MTNPLTQPDSGLAPFDTTGGALATAEAMPWNVDSSHTEVSFSVRHFFTPVTGSFTSYDVDLSYDPAAPENSRVRVEIDVTSIDTGNEARDTHLRSPDFFDTERFPRATFESTSVRQEGADKLVALGNLTLKGITREIELQITVLGIQDLPSEVSQMLGGITQVAGFQASTRIDRRDFQVGVSSWAQTTIIGGEVEMKIAVEANRS